MRTHFFKTLLEKDKNDSLIVFKLKFLVKWAFNEDREAKAPETKTCRNTLCNIYLATLCENLIEIGYKVAGY